MPIASDRHIPYMPFFISLLLKEADGDFTNTYEQSPCQSPEPSKESTHAQPLATRTGHPLGRSDILLIKQISTSDCPQNFYLLIHSVRSPIHALLGGR